MSRPHTYVPAKVKQLFHQCALVGAMLAAGAPTSGLHSQQGEVGAGEASSDPGAFGRASYSAAQTVSEIRIDGQLDEDAWGEAAAVLLSYETAPGDNAPARVETLCRVLHDPAQLYFGCRASDPDPGSIRAFITDRDDTDGHDRVILSLDPFNDGRRAFEFSVSALGVQGDGVYDEQTGMSDGSWDAIWRSAGRVTADGYVVEVAIPFRSLRFPDTDGVQTWGFHARREWPRSTRVELRSMRWDRSNACVLCQANLLTGIGDVSPGINLEINPTLTARRTDARADFPDGAFRNGAISPEPGLDVRWNVTTDLALNLTANPDFSQVEADAPQLDVNSRFALFFPEKRPFFLEGADFFGTPLQAVFTRTVADPIGGSKMSGKIGASAVGAMVTVDRVNHLLFPGNQGSSPGFLADEVTTTVGRFRRDVGESGAIGGLYTGRIGADYSNHVVGADAFFRPLTALSVRTQILHSATRYPGELAAAHEQPQDVFGGDALSLEARISSRTWRLETRARWITTGFRADAGFIPQVDVRGFELWGGRDFWPAGGFFSRLSASTGGWHFEATDGTLSDEGIWVATSFAGPWQSDVWVNPNLSRQHFAGEIYDLFQVWGGASLQPTGSLSLAFDGMIGGGIDFRNARQGTQILVNPSLELRIGRHLDLRVRGSFQRMGIDGEEVFTALVTQTRAVYNFTPRAFLRAILQFGDTDRGAATNPGLRTLEDRTLRAQLLFSYKVNPLTVLFLGYSDDRRGERPLAGDPIPLTGTDRAFFVKVGYAWRP